MLQQNHLQSQAIGCADDIGGLEPFHFFNQPVDDLNFGYVGGGGIHEVSSYQQSQQLPPMSSLLPGNGDVMREDFNDNHLNHPPQYHSFDQEQHPHSNNQQPSMVNFEDMMQLDSQQEVDYLTPTSTISGHNEDKSNNYNGSFYESHQLSIQHHHQLHKNSQFTHNVASDLTVNHSSSVPNSHFVGESSTLMSCDPPFGYQQQYPQHHHISSPSLSNLDSSHTSLQSTEHNNNNNANQHFHSESSSIFSSLHSYDYQVPSSTTGYGNSNHHVIDHSQPHQIHQTQHSITSSQPTTSTAATSDGASSTTTEILHSLGLYAENAESLMADSDLKDLALPPTPQPFLPPPPPATQITSGGSNAFHQLHQNGENNIHGRKRDREHEIQSTSHVSSSSPEDNSTAGRIGRGTSQARLGKSSSPVLVTVATSTAPHPTPSTLTTTLSSSNISMGEEVRSIGGVDSSGEQKSLPIVVNTGHDNSHFPLLPSSDHETSNFSSSHVAVDITGDLIEETICFRCKVCNFLSLDRSAIDSHVRTLHRDHNSSHYLHSSNTNSQHHLLSFPIGGDYQSSHNGTNSSSINSSSHAPFEPHVITQTNTTSAMHVQVSLPSSAPPTTFICSSCQKSFSSLEDCKRHMTLEHAADVTLITLIHSATRGGKEPDSVTGTVASNPPVVHGLIKSTDHLNNNNLSRLVPKTNETNVTNGQTTDENSKTNDQKKNGKKNKVVKNKTTSMDKETGSKTESVYSTNEEKLSKKTKSETKRKAWRKKAEKESTGVYLCEKPKCSVKFSSQEKLDLHQKCHMDSGSGFTCCQCDDYRSEHWASVAGHMWRHHSIDMDLYKCDQCDYRSWSYSNLENTHKKIHSQEKNYSCNLCKKSFKNQKQLINHKVRHDPPKGKPSKNGLVTDSNNNSKNPLLSLPSTDLSQETSESGVGIFLTPPLGNPPVAETIKYECELCAKKFEDARPLRIHMDMVHKKKRPYTCQQCGYSAASRGALRVHVRCHTGEKPFKCDQCDYSTSDHNSLRRHKMRHSGERPYKCPFCDYACIQVSERLLLQWY